MAVYCCYFSLQSKSITIKCSHAILDIRSSKLVKGDIAAIKSAQILRPVGKMSNKYSSNMKHIFKTV